MSDVLVGACLLKTYQSTYISRIKGWIDEAMDKGRRMGKVTTDYERKGCLYTEGKRGRNGV